MKRRALVVIPVLALVGAAGWWLFLRQPGEAGNGLEASGTVEATEARLGFQLAGRLTEVAVRAGDRVAAGTVLARLDQAETQARRRQMEAQVAASQALLEEMQRGFRREEIGQARAAVEAAEVRLADAETDLARTTRLHAGGAVSREALDKAEVAVEVARRELARAGEQLRLLESGTREERIAAQRAQVAQARAGLEAVEATLDTMSLTAPFDGVVTVRHREPGEIVAPGSPVVTLTDLDDRWVRIYIREDSIGAVQLGAGATIHSDTFPERHYTGQVFFIASEAEFTPKNVQTQEERVRLVYAVKVRITGDPGYELKPGMPADVRLETAP